MVLLLLASATAEAESLPSVVKTHHVTKRAYKDEIEDLEQKWRVAIMTDDVSAMDKLLSDDYVGISMSGQVNTKLMQLDRLRAHSLRLTRLDLSDVKIKLVGPVAIVTCLSQVEGTIDGKDTHGTFRSTRVYQRLPNGTWQMTNFEATRVPNGERASR